MARFFLVVETTEDVYYRRVKDSGAKTDDLDRDHQTYIGNSTTAIKVDTQGQLKMLMPIYRDGIRYIPRKHKAPPAPIKQEEDPAPVIQPGNVPASPEPIVSAQVDSPKTSKKPEKLKAGPRKLTEEESSSWLTDSRDIYEASDALNHLLKKTADGLHRFGIKAITIATGVSNDYSIYAYSVADAIDRIKKSYPKEQLDAMRVDIRLEGECVKFPRTTITQRGVKVYKLRKQKAPEPEKGAKAEPAKKPLKSTGSKRPRGRPTKTKKAPR